MLVILKLDLELKIRIGLVDIVHSDLHAIHDTRTIDRSRSGDRADSADLNGLSRRRAHHKARRKHTRQRYGN